MKKFHVLYIKDMLQAPYFIKNFSILLCSFMLVFFLSALLADDNSRKILENELKASNENYTEIFGNSIDSYIKDMRYIIASLDTDSMVTTYFSSKNPENTIPDIHQRLQEKLYGYTNSYTSVASVYLYSGLSNTVITSKGVTPASSFKDIGWSAHLGETSSPYVLFPRAYLDNYPFYLTLMKNLTINGADASIIINIELEKLPFLQETQTRYSEFYIITDNLQVLYRPNRRNYLESLSVSLKLENFSANREFYSFIDTESSYVYTQLHSSEYSWSYVLISNLDEYSNELSSRRAFLWTILLGLLLIVLLFSLIINMRFFQPIQMLTDLLNQSTSLLENTRYPSKEISELASKIICYAQTNKQLSDELSSSLKKLNQSEMLALQAQINPHFLFNTLNVIYIEECRALGYEHSVPELTLKLVHIMRHATDSTNMITLETEIQYIKDYIDLMNHRSNKRLQIIYDIEPETLSALVPKLFIQPIIENVFFHSFPDGIEEKDKLSISIRKEGDYISVSISDNGIGIDEENYAQLMNYLKDSSFPQSNIGIKNVIRRMKLLYQEQFTINIQTKRKLPV